MGTSNQASRQYLEASNLPFWVRMRLTALAALVISFALLVTISAASAHQLTLVVIKYKPVAPEQTNRPAVFQTGPVNQNGTIFTENWLLRASLWNAIAKAEEDATRWYATSAWFTGFDSPVEDKEAFEARVVLTHFSKAVEGLGPSMVLAPCSSALTGVYMIYQALSFFAYTKRILNAAPTWLESVTFLTRHGFGFSMAALVFMTTVLLWIFEIIIGTAFQGGADGVVGLQIESAKFGGALVVTSVALVLQLFVLFVQFQLFSKRELRDYQDRDQSPPPLPDMPIDRPFDIEEGLTDEKDARELEIGKKDLDEAIAVHSATSERAAVVEVPQAI